MFLNFRYYLWVCEPFRSLSLTIEAEIKRMSSCSAPCFVGWHATPYTLTNKTCIFHTNLRSLYWHVWPSIYYLRHFEPPSPPKDRRLSPLCRPTIPYVLPSRSFLSDPLFGPRPYSPSTEADFGWVESRHKGSGGLTRTKVVSWTREPSGATSVGTGGSSTDPLVRTLPTNAKRDPDLFPRKSDWVIESTSGRSLLSGGGERPRGVTYHVNRRTNGQ